MTQDQKALIKKHQYASIKFLPGEKMPAPAFCTKGKVHYEVFLAKEYREDKTKKKFLRTLLLHELGHLECRHLDVNYDSEIATVKALKEKYEKDNNIKDEDKKYFDMMLVLNLAGDLEVNSKYLTFGDIKYLTEQGFAPVTLQSFNTTFKEDFRDYYEDVIAELYKRPAIPVVIMDMEASSQGGSGGSGYGKGKRKSKEKSDSSDKGSESEDDPEGKGKGKDKPETDTVSGVMRSSCDDYDKEMSDGDDEDEEESPSDGKNKSQGTGNGKVIVARSKRETEEELTKLLLSIKDVHRSKQLDSIRLYNRGTRRNKAGVLYSSVRRKVTKSTEKLGILIDTSGSMNISSVMKSIETIAKVAPELHTDTKVKCWQERKTDEFFVSDIPEYIHSGGGTHLPSGLAEFLDEGYDNVVIYSDFCDTLQHYIDVLDERPCKLYLVSTYSDENLKGGGYGGRETVWEELKRRAVKIIFTSEA